MIKRGNIPVFVDEYVCELVQYEDTHESYVDDGFTFESQSKMYYKARNIEILVRVKETGVLLTIHNPKYASISETSIDIRGVFKRYEPLSEWQLAYARQYDMNIDYNSDDRLKTTHAITFKTGYEKGYDSRNKHTC